MAIAHTVRRSYARWTLLPSSQGLILSGHSTLTCNLSYRACHGRRYASTVPDPSNAKIEQIVDTIGKLTLLETATLITSLKERLNIPDMPMASFTAAGGSAAAAPVEEEEAAPVAAEKTLFDVRLESFEAGSKPKIIKEIKGMLGLSLVESKKFVESTPKVMKEGIVKDDAEKIIKTLEALGAKVVMV